MSGAAARTDLSFPALIAGSLGLKPGPSRGEGVDYYYPEWPKGGLPANIEAVLRRLNLRYGNSVSGLDWMSVLQTVNQVIDRSEDYYEREGGAEDRPYHGKVPYFHNIALWGFTVADAWMVTPALCLEEIAREKPGSGGDGWMAVANATFYRTALKVLNPNLDGQRQYFSQIDWLNFHVQEQGVENLILYLGANNILKTILTMSLRPTPNLPSQRPHHSSHRQRRKQGWNLWQPEDFEAEYSELMKRVDLIMSGRNRYPHWRIFLATIPSMRTTPLLKGFGHKSHLGKRGLCYKYYTYIQFKADYALKRQIFLPLHQVLFIDDCIREYNRIIKQAAKEKNDLHEKKYRRRPYVVVDIHKSLEQKILPEIFDSIKPPVTFEFYHVDKRGKRKRGGLFSLDGVHPSVIGHGLMAHTFMAAMEQSGVQFKPPLNWQKIIASDSLLNQPISMMQEIYNHQRLSEQIIKMVRLAI